jgi:hypothetical protein
MMKNRITLLILAASAAALLAGCNGEIAPSAASREARQTEILASQAAVTVGFPAVKNYAEKRMLKTVYELRDSPNVATYTYTTDMAGKLHKVCPTTSIGFPIPYATQFTAPKAMQRWYLPSTADYQSARGTRDADQPEPNGLHMPASADATWVACLNPKTKDMAVTYIEDKVRTYLFEMPSVD